MLAVGDGLAAIGDGMVAEGDGLVLAGAGGDVLPPHAHKNNPNITVTTRSILINLFFQLPHNLLGAPPG